MNKEEIISMQSTSFCKINTFEDQLYKYLNENIINLCDDKIAEIYNYFKENYFENKDVRRGKDINELKYSKSVIAENQRVPPTSILRGIDLPVWYNNIKTAKYKIVILGIDPLRNKTTYKYYDADENNDVILGTPYALHLKWMRDGKTKHYTNFIEELAKENFVYITDVFKTFYISENERSYNGRTSEQKDLQKNLLIKELKIINPDIIITFGKIALNQLDLGNEIKLSDKLSILPYNELSQNVKIIPMLHLSNSVRPNNYDAFFSHYDFIDINERKNKGIAFSKIIVDMLQ